MVHRGIEWLFVCRVVDRDRRQQQRSCAVIMGGVARNGVLCRPIGLAAFGTSRDLLAARVASYFSQFSVVSRSLSRSRTPLYRAKVFFDVNELFSEKFRRGILLRLSLRFDRLIFEVRCSNRMVLSFGMGLLN